MDVLELKDIQIDSGYIYYRRNYQATVVLQLPVTTVEVPIDFLIETGPTGKKDIDINLKVSVDYPLLPVKKKVSEYISSMDSEGRLPC